MANDRLYFTTVNAANRRSLWTTDGTVPGTREITFPSTGVAGLTPSGFARLEDRAVF